MKQKLWVTLAAITTCLGIGGAPVPVQGACDYPWQTDSAGRRCGGRAASVIPGGRLGGDGRYTDGQGRQRLYGRNNDPYDRPSDPGFQTRQRSGYRAWTTRPLWGTQEQGRNQGSNERRRYGDW